MTRIDVAAVPRHAKTAAARGALLSVRQLVAAYDTGRGLALAVDHVDLEVQPAEIVGLAGESGCGKSTVAHAILRLIAPPGYIMGGDILFDGTDVLKLAPELLRRFRWDQVSIVTQSAMNALNPVSTIRRQLRDTYLAHRRIRREEADDRARDLLGLVGLPERALDSYAHELSGGMRQRAVIALALALEPRMVVMDEPTTALDVVVQQEIVVEILRLREQIGFAVLFITHDLALLGQLCDRISVMYAGKVVESAPARQLIREPRHPYSRALLESVPSLSGPMNRLEGIPGSLPNLVDPPSGCRFAPRCPAVLPRCHDEPPPVTCFDEGDSVACHLYGNGMADS